MAKKRIELIWEFLKAARNLVKNKDMSKEGILRFAKQQFGEVPGYLRVQIDKLFKAKPKTQKKGEVVPIKKQEGLVRRPEEFATRKEYEKYLDETLGPGDDVFGNPIKEDLLRKWDKVNAKNVTPKADAGIKSTQEYKDIVEELRKSEIGNTYAGEDLEKAALDMLKIKNKNKKRLEAEQALKKRTDDIASGDIEGTGAESLGTSMKKLKELVDELKKTSQDTIPGGIMDEILKGQKVMSEGYKKGNIRTAVRWFMRQEADAGKLKLSKDDYDALKVYAQTSEADPIEIFRRYYGEDALEQIDEIGDVFRQGESFDHYAQLLRENVHSSVLKPKTKNIGKYDPNVLTPQQEDELRKQLLKEQEQKQLLEDFDVDPDRQPNADGGLINILKL